MARNTDALLLAALLGVPRTRTLSSRDKQAIADQRELDKVLAELRIKLKHDLPTLSDKGLDRMTEVTFGLTVTLGEDVVSDSMLHEAANKILEILVTARIDWALEVSKVILDTKIRPAYDNARRAGVDPVAVLMANFQLTREKAETAVREFSKDDGPDLTKAS